MSRISVVIITAAMCLGPASAFSKESMINPVQYNYPPVNHYINGTCNITLRPDKAVIAGGMSVESVMPGEAREKLDTQVEVLKAYVEKQGGQYVPLERVRAVNPAQGGRHGEMAEAMPFLSIQRMELEFPVATDIDAVLEKVLQLGMDRYGNQMTLHRSGGQPQIIVRYRFSGVEENINSLIDSCKHSAVVSWCEAEGRLMGHRWCDDEKPERRFVVKNMNLQSQPVMQENGYVNALSLYYSGGNLNVPRLELMGNIELKLKGAISLSATGN